MRKAIKSYLHLKSLIYFFALVAGWPCVFYLMGWLPDYQINYLMLFALAALYAVTKGVGKLPVPCNGVLFFQIFCWMIYSVIHLDGSYFTRILLLATTFFILSMQDTDRYPLRFAKIFTGWVALQVVLGAIGVILVFVIGLQPLFEFKEMDGRPGYFFGLFTTNTYVAGLVRNAGFYDEPGALAFWGIFALLINKLYIKNKIMEYALMIGLISTLSLAYFIQLIAYLFVFYKKNKGKLVIIATVLLLAVSYFTSKSDQMNDAIYGRMEYNEKNGTISGDNRSVLMERCWNIFEDYPICGMGAQKLASREVAREYGFVGANFFFNWAADGIIGFFITYLPLFFIFGLSKKDKKYMGVGLILLVGFIQRPYDSTQLLYPLLTYTILYLGLRETNKNMQKQPCPNLIRG